MDGRIVLIGAGSASFGIRSVRDAINMPALKGSCLVLHDIDEKRLDAMAKLADIMNDEVGSDLEIQSTSVREEALDGADFVVLSIAVDRLRTWTQDWEIPLKYGIKQVIAENGGLGGLFQTMRVVPPVLEICHDMETICPKAILFNYTNPVPRVSLAISRYSDINVVGLCHEVEAQKRRLAPIIGVPPEELEVTSAGLNHFSWFKELRLKDGEDAYPLLDAGLKNVKDFQPLCRALYEKFGLYPSTDDNHAGEYLPYAWDLCPPQERGLNWIKEMDNITQTNLQKLSRVIEGKDKIDARRISGEPAIRMIAGIISNSGHREYQVNMPNEGQISNLPQDAVVETPALVDRSGVHLIHVGELPRGIAALCNIQCVVQDMAVEAAVHGDKNLALQAALVDPIVNDLIAAEKAFEELFEAQKGLLPQFK